MDVFLRLPLALCSGRAGAPSRSALAVLLVGLVLGLAGCGGGSAGPNSDSVPVTRAVPMFDTATGLLEIPSSQLWGAREAVL
jgi:hypothetical protein